MSYAIRFTLALLLLSALTACGIGQSQPSARVTALPPSQDTVALAATVTVTPPLSASATPASGFGALMAAQTSSPQAPSATPLSNDLALGDAQAIAAATDTALQPTPRSRLSFEQSPVSITFGEFYDGYNLRTGLILSDKLVSLDGQRVTMEGYMAPPLKPNLDFFVLTRIRLAFCPFCSTTADWPDDIALIYLADNDLAATQYPVRISGRIEVGGSVDQETGMVSLVRIYADQVEALN
ncbi:MAG: hypothetical protein H7Y11_04660 [Armatimonadetes bacterium]|nr:hypothetical protein [Anaerolineae bacterium]